MDTTSAVPGFLLQKCKENQKKKTKKQKLFGSYANQKDDEQAPSGATVVSEGPQCGAAFSTYPGTPSTGGGGSEEDVFPSFLQPMAVH